MPPQRQFHRRANKHAKTLHCECEKSFTRADHFERHKRICQHSSEYVAVCEQLPDPASDDCPFYCSCGVGFTAAHAFNLHCMRTRHSGDWLRCKYQPRGHHEIHTAAGDSLTAVNSADHQQSAQSVAAQITTLCSSDHEICDSLSTSTISNGSDEMRHSTTEYQKEQRMDLMLDSTDIKNNYDDAGKSSAGTDLRTYYSPTSSSSYQADSTPKSDSSREASVSSHSSKYSTAPKPKKQVSFSPRLGRHGSQSRGESKSTQKRTNAGISKIRKFKRSFAKNISKHKDKICAVLAVAAGAYWVQNYPLPPLAASISSHDWLVDSNAPRHIAKDSAVFSNVDALYKICPGTHLRPSCEWTGTVPLKLNSGKTLLLEDVLYNLWADTNVVSLAKLGEAGLKGTWTSSELTINNATDNDLVARAVNTNNVYRLDDLAPPSSSTKYPSREKTEGSRLPPSKPEGNRKQSDPLQGTRTISTAMLKTSSYTPTKTYPPLIIRKTPTPILTCPEATVTSQNGSEPVTRPTFESPGTLQLEQQLDSHNRYLDTASDRTGDWGIPGWPFDWPRDRVPAPSSSTSSAQNETASNHTSPAVHTPTTDSSRLGFGRFDFVSSGLDLASSGLDFASSGLNLTLPSNPPISVPSNLSISVPSNLSISVPSNLSISVPSNLSISSPSKFPTSFPTFGPHVDARQYALDKQAEGKAPASKHQQMLDQKVGSFRRSVCPPCEPCTAKCWLV